MRSSLLISILLLSLLLPSCNPFKTATERMDRAENAIETAPEQALASLDSVRRITLITAPRRARFALLMAMTLDKGAFLNKVVSPYIDFKGGMMTDYTFSGTGWFVSPSIGISFCRRFSVFAAGEGTVNYYGRGTGRDYQKADIHPWSVGFTVSF